MRNKNNVELQIMIFGALTFLFILFELIMIEQNNEALSSSKKDPYLPAREFSILFNISFSFVEGVRGIYRTNVGYLIIYYVLIFFVVYRNIFQTKDFDVGVIYIIQCVVLGLTILYFTYVAFNVFYTSFWMTFKFIGANKRVINAYVVRLSLKAFKEAYFVYCLLVTFYLSYPDLFPGIGKEYKAWKLAYIPGFIITSYNEDDENVYRKIADIVLWFCIFLELLLNRVVKSIVNKKGGFAVDTYFCVILFMYTCLSIIDFWMYGSGLKEFIKNRKKPKDMNIEN